MFGFCFYIGTRIDEDLCGFVGMDGPSQGSQAVFVPIAEIGTCAEQQVDHATDGRKGPHT